MNYFDFDLNEAHISLLKRFDFDLLGGSSEIFSFWNTINWNSRLQLFSRRFELDERSIILINWEYWINVWSHLFSLNFSASGENLTGVTAKSALDESANRRQILIDILRLNRLPSEKQETWRTGLSLA